MGKAKCCLLVRCFVMSVEAASTEPLEFWDSHFHIWDATQDAPLQSGIDAELLAGATPGDDKNYRYAALATELQSLNGRDTPLVYSGGCFIEAMSVCFPKKLSALDLNPLCVQEARWAERELLPLPPLEGKSFFLCPSVQLQAKNAAATLAEVARCRNVRGIRQILNFRADDPEKCHPRNSEDFLADPAFRKNFGLLAKHDLHFETQVCTSTLLALVLFDCHSKRIALASDVGLVTGQSHVCDFSLLSFAECALCTAGGASIRVGT